MNNEKKAKIDSVEVGVWIIISLILYLILCFLSWVVINIAVEWGYVSEYQRGMFAAIETTIDPVKSGFGQKIVFIYQLINLPRGLYIYFLSTYQFTTVVSSALFGLIVWELLKGKDSK